MGINEEQLEGARDAMCCYQVMTGSEPETVLTDLLASLMHLADHNGEDFKASLERAERHYQHEVWEAGQTGEA